MPKFLIIDERKYPLEMGGKYSNKDMVPFYRWEHRATVSTKGRRFIVFIDQLQGEAFIEEVTTGDLKKIGDDDLWEEIKVWASAMGFFRTLPPVFKPDNERFV